MKFIHFLLSKHFWVHIGLIIVLLIVVLFGSLIAIKNYTNHGESITVPNLVDLTVAEVESLLQKQHLTYTIADSSYIVGQLPLTVLAQNPKPFSKVKKGTKDGGELVIVDFFDAVLPVGPKHHKVSIDTVIDELKQAGYSQFEVNVNLLPYQYIIRAK